jgi:hypothetical protein
MQVPHNIFDITVQLSPITLCLHLIYYRATLTHHPPLAEGKILLSNIWEVENIELEYIKVEYMRGAI